MPTKHLSLRLESETFDRLDQQSRRAGQSRSGLAKMLLEEGLRMDGHPGIVFRWGPAGRRPGLADGPDIWEVARVFRGLESADEDIIGQSVELTGLTPQQIKTAMRYYLEFREEIDNWMDRVDEEADRLEAAWRREQDTLKR